MHNFPKKRNRDRQASYATSDKTFANRFDKFLSLAFSVNTVFSRPILFILYGENIDYFIPENYSSQNILLSVR